MVLVVGTSKQLILVDSLHGCLATATTLAHFGGASLPLSCIDHSFFIILCLYCSLSIFSLYPFNLMPSPASPVIKLNKLLRSTPLSKNNTLACGLQHQTRNTLARPCQVAATRGVLRPEREAFGCVSFFRGPFLWLVQRNAKNNPPFCQVFLRKDTILVPSPFFPGILLSRKPPDTQEKKLYFLKRTMVGKNGESTPRTMWVCLPLKTGLFVSQSVDHHLFPIAATLWTRPCGPW